MPDGVLYVPCGDRRATSARRARRPTAPTPTNSSAPASSAAKASPPPSPPTRRCSPPLTAPSFGPVHTRQRQPQDGEGRALPDAPRPHRLPARQAPDLHRPAHRGPPLARPADLPGLLRPRRTTSSGTPGPANSGAAPPSPSAALLKPLERAHGVKLRVSYGKVAEYQRRGVVHFHALIRLDLRRPRRPGCDTAPTGRDHRRTTWASSSPPPSPSTALPDAGLPRHHALLAHRPGARQLDVRPLRTGSVDRRRRTGREHRGRRRLPRQVRHQGHRAHRATAHRPDDRRDRRVLRDPDTHLGRLIAYACATRHPARSIATTTEQQRQDWHDTYGRLRRWTHMLGFGGHFATKSRRYSTTHKAAARRPPRLAAHHPRRLARPPPARRLVVDHRRRHHPDRLRPHLRRHRLEHHRRRPTRHRAAARAREHRALTREERTTA